MSRLFVAIAIPQSPKITLQAVQKHCPATCKYIDRENWHITLQFIGDNSVNAVDECLQQVNGQCFDVNLTEPGYFGRLKNGAILWWGVESVPELSGLHDAIQCALQEKFGKEKIISDKGGFQPHVTLARCKHKIVREDIESFLQQPPLSGCRFSVNRFGLYSSKTDQQGAHYTLEKSYLLKPASQ